MKARARKRTAAVPAPRARSANSRQRQLLIEACISALYTYGPSGTTVERVVAIANMSPGIVRFYFDSKAAMLVASLKHLAAEFESQVMVPVTKLKATPVAALELLVDLYLDPDIASARKVTVWYAYWGEASSREEYYDICGQKDESFAQLVRDLISRLIETLGTQHLDPDGIALGFIGALEILWQDIAFQSEDAVDRVIAKRRCRAYLRSVFPVQFVGAESAVESQLANWTYHSSIAFVAERDTLLREAWSCIGHTSMLPVPGSFLTADTATERVLVVRDLGGVLRAYRNNCPQQAHRLVDAGSGVAAQWRCATHGLRFNLDGSAHDSSGQALTGIHLVEVGGLLTVRAEPPKAGDGAGLLDVLAGLGLSAAHLLRAQECVIEADWKSMVELWFEGVGSTQGDVWSRQRYQALHRVAAAWEERFVAPNHWLQVRPDGITLSEAVALSAGRCMLRRIELSYCGFDAVARALAYLGARRPPAVRRSHVAMLESLQIGRTRFNYSVSRRMGSVDPAAAFRQRLIERLPLLSLSRAPAVG